MDLSASDWRMYTYMETTLPWSNTIQKWCQKLGKTHGTFCKGTINSFNDIKIGMKTLDHFTVTLIIYCFFWSLSFFMINSLIGLQNCVNHAIINCIVYRLWCFSHHIVCWHYSSGSWTWTRRNQAAECKWGRIKLWYFHT